MVFLRARLADGFAFSVLALLLACGGGDVEPDEGGLAADTPAETSIAENPDGKKPIPREFVAPQKREGNGAPEILAVRFEPERPTPGESVRAVAETEDPDGDNVWLEFTWSLDGEVVEGATTARLLLRDAPKGARLEVEVVASDGKGRSEPWLARTEVYNAIPELGVVRMKPEVVVAGDQPIVLRPEATDSDGDVVSFEYTWKVNDREVEETGNTLSTKGLRRGDRVSVTVLATDGTDSSDAYELPEIRVANAAPVILSTPGDPATEAGVIYQIHAEDPDGDPGLQYALEDAPAGMTVNSRTGAIDWEPTPSQAGTHTITIVVDDLRGGRSRQAIEVTAGDTTAADQPPARSR
jgi:hypothetical protein